MARIVNSIFTPDISLVVQTVFEDGTTSDFIIKEGTGVTALRYISDKEVKEVTGKVVKINYEVANVNRTYTDPVTVKSYFAEDVTCTSIIVDCSKEYESILVEVPCREIVEFFEQKNVDRMKYYLKYEVSYEIHLTDLTVNNFILHEGDDLTSLEYLNMEIGDESFIDGRLIAYKYADTLEPEALIMLNEGVITEIPILCVKNLAEVITPVPPVVETITEAITNTETGIVSIANGLVTEPITVSKSVVIRGAKADIPANVVSTSVNSRTKAVSTVAGINTARANIEEETVITEKIIIEDGCSIELNGVTLTGNALLSMTQFKDITLKNCVIKDLNPTASKTFIIQTPTSEEAAKMVIKNCYFGANIKNDNGSFYNGFELNGLLANGSEFSENYFEKGSCNHNDINLYSVAPDATITIRNNIWEYSGNAIRIGIKGEPKCTVDIIDNTYHTTDETYPDYAGLLLIQPYGKQTTSFANCTINIKGTVHTDKYQVYYMYAGSNDMQFTEANVPTIYLDDVCVVKPVNA